MRGTPVWVAGVPSPRQGNTPVPGGKVPQSQAEPSPQQNRTGVPPGQDWVIPLARTRVPSWPRPGYLPGIGYAWTGYATDSMPLAVSRMRTVCFYLTITFDVKSSFLTKFLELFQVVSSEQTKKPQNSSIRNAIFDISICCF